MTLLDTAAATKCQQDRRSSSGTRRVRRAHRAPGLNGTNGTNGANGTNGVSGYEVVSVSGPRWSADCPVSARRTRTRWWRRFDTRRRLQLPDKQQRSLILGIIDSPAGGPATAFAICANVSYRLTPPSTSSRGEAIARAGLIRRRNVGRRSYCASSDAGASRCQRMSISVRPARPACNALTNCASAPWSWRACTVAWFT